MKSNLKFSLALLPIAIQFFVMGFVDIVGVASNHVKADFGLTDGFASLMPMMVFMWFAICAVPSGLLMHRIGRRNTVGLALAVTVLATVIPLVMPSYIGYLLAFMFLGIGNTGLQVSLNPLIASVVEKNQLSSTLTMGQFVKAISSFLGPVLVGFVARVFGDWRLSFLVYGCISLVAIVALYLMYPADSSDRESSTSSFREVFNLLKQPFFVKCVTLIMLIVGIDVGLNVSIPKLLMHRLDIPLNEAALGSSFYFATRTIGTFIGALLLLRVSARKFLSTSLSGAIVGGMVLCFASSWWMLMLGIAVLGLTCANVFSIVFSLALQQQPSRTNDISALLIMGVSGGALMVPIQGVVTDLTTFIWGFSVIGLAIVLARIIAYQLAHFHKPMD